VDYLKSIGGPLPGLRFCPTGGITPANAPSYLALPNVGCVGGSWLTPKDALVAKDFARIEALAKDASTL
jgi:2-dehydro-3-deoxyphosphogluconate aldolase/(4S)-4-hydroxy-2-oxoglutarate aldolase